ncbi:restriction endonuclease subunit S [Cesiribacter sp. SM1]|uniref:restriction endonuclease subunit S n=1 Tax=Cesiribacter sp. SM1 TaxID=2861196 RepID=UPI001CD6462A|nr:restriction endonuclease subunit S [Cesiribacter sp. SM1]
MSVWQIISLGDAATFINGHAFKPEDWSDEGKEIIRIQNLTKSSKEVNYFKGRLSDRYKVKKGDLLISWSATLGIYEWTGKDAWLNQHIFKVQFDKKAFDKSFFRYLIQHSLNEMGREVHGSTMKHITKKRFDKFKIPYPPLELQKRIAQALYKADAIRQRNHQILQKYDQLAQSLFLDMFGDPVRNEKGWNVISFEKVAKNENSKRVPVKQADRDSREGAFPYYGATGIIDTIDDYRFDGEYLLIAEDGKNLLFRRKNNAFIAKGKFWVNNHAHVLSYNGVAELEYLEYLINAYDLTPFVTGIDQFKLNKNNLEKIPVPLPPLELQKKFSTIVEKIEAIKLNAQKELAESETLYQSLLQKAFSGELFD